jgi:crotonobetainyl-CoA:carnitine CoA-transferase CaiB-like acyl-CoA transferase
MAPGMGDHSTATALFGAIMTGLYRRERTGEGSLVSTSLAANGVWANGMALQGVIAGNNVGTYRQKKGWPNPFTDAYQCSTGDYVVLAIINTQREYPQLAAALNRQSWLDDDRFSSVAALMKHRPEFRVVMDEAFAQFTYAEVSELLEQAGVTYSRVQPMADILTDQQLRENDIVVETGDTGEGYDLTIASPINVLESPKRAPTRAPDAVGENSLDVLRELEFDESYIQALLAQEVVIDAATSIDTEKKA